jgi:hypothetical protein
MYSKEEASKLKQQFWITFGKYLKPIPSAEGGEINWVNYKTGIKHIFFRMNANQREAKISIDIAHPDSVKREIYYNQFLAFKTILHETLGEEWIWEPAALNEVDATLSQISITLPDVNVFDQQSWPQLISFLKTRIIALDSFWADVKPVFEAL